MSIIYSDIRKSFAAHPLSGDILLNTNEDAVKDSIINLIFTGKYERYRKIRIGAGIPQDLFDNITQETEYEVKTRIQETIENYEPRANIINISVTANNDSNHYEVVIVFNTVNSFKEITINNILRRIR